MPIPAPFDAYGSYQMTSTSPYDSNSGVPAPNISGDGSYLMTSNKWFNTALMGLGWFVAAGLALHWLNERRGFPEDLGHIRVDGHSVLAAGISASIFIMLVKFITIRWTIPGVSQVVQTYL